MKYGARELTKSAKANRTMTRPIAERITLAFTLALSLTGHALAQTPLRVSVFQGISNMPIFAAQAEGYFARHGLSVELINTRNSDDLRDGLAAGSHQIAHAGVDNAVALAESGKAEVAVVIGGNAGFGRLITQPYIAALGDLRGRKVAVDAPNTANALVLYKVLQGHGLARADYQVAAVGGTALVVEAMLKDATLAAAIISPPFAFRALQGGLKDHGHARAANGAFQFDAGFVTRPWATANAEVLVRYLQSYVEGVRWTLDGANRSAAVALLAARLKLSAGDAAQTYALIVHPETGIARDARLDLSGFRNTLALRAEILGQWGGNAPPAERFVDLSYYQRALDALK